MEDFVQESTGFDMDFIPRDRRRAFRADDGHDHLIGDVHAHQHQTREQSTGKEITNGYRIR